MHESQYTWVSFYKELADKLILYRNNRTELILVIETIFNNIGINMPKMEEDGSLTDIDPFTIFGMFNKKLTSENRIKIISEFKKEFNIEADLPTDFDGVPVLMNLNANYFRFEKERGDHDIDKLWDVCVAATKYADNRSDENEIEFIEAYDKAKDLKGNKWKLTIALYWIRPETFINLDSRNRWFFDYSEKIPDSFIEQHEGIREKANKIPDGKEYLSVSNELNSMVRNSGSYSSLMGFSYNAWKEANKVNEEKARANSEWIAADYDPGFTVDDWIELIENHDVFNETSLEIMKRMKDIGGSATCSELADKYGEAPQFYNIGSTKLAKRIIDVTECTPRKNNDNGDERWSILYTGKYVSENKRKGNFIWKLRDELSEALNNVDLSDVKLYAETSADEILVADNISKTRLWIYSLGENAYCWDEFRKLGIMGIGYEEIGDLREYKTKEDIRVSLRMAKDPDKSYKQSAYMAWQFVHGMKPGDIVFAKKGRYKIIGYGVVESDYIYKPNEKSNFCNIRKVSWKKSGEWDHPGVSVTKTLTDITDYTDYAEKLKDIFSIEDIDDEPVVIYDPYTKEDFLEDVYIEEEQYDLIKEVLNRKKNIVLQGAPGTGKTFAAKRLAYSIIGELDTERVQMIQFHQSYSYEDFIMGYRPTETGFELTNGVFYKFCKKAEIDDENKYFFIIDEINRGNISKIFGELFMLIESDKRDVSVELLYGAEKFKVPSNVYIIGMMNTADRSLAMIDYALRRRFAFFDFKPAFDSLGFNKYLEDKNNHKLEKLVNCVKRLNREIREDMSLGEGFEIGHSYFITKNNVTDDFLKMVVDCELNQLLNEYWYDEPEKVENWHRELKAAIK